MGTTPPPATAVRHQTLRLLCALSALTYLDRVCFAAATPTIRADLGFASADDLWLAITAFTVAYAAFEVPSGWWGDRFGPRGVLLRIVLWWSLFTALTGAVGLAAGGVVLGGVGTLAAVRFAFGAGEAGAYPNIARAVYNWFPAAERGAALGRVWMAGRLAGAFTPLLWTVLVTGTAYTPGLMSWRAAFALFGLLGVGWCVVFARRFRDTPVEHPGVGPAELALIAADRGPGEAHRGVPWRRVLLSRNLLALYAMYFAVTYGWYFYISYLPSCLESGYGVAPTSLVGSLFKGAPLLAGAAGCLAGGRLTDALVRRGWTRRWARRGPGAAAMTLSAGCYAVAAVVPEAWMFAAAVAASAFFTDVAVASAWAACGDVGGRSTGVVAGCMNTAGSLGATAAVGFTSLVLQRIRADRAAALGTTPEALPAADLAAAALDGYQTNLWIFAAVATVAAGLWFAIDAGKRIDDAE